MRIAVALLACVAVASAETKQERGKAIIDEALAAMGGDRFLAMQDRVESGRAYSFYREELSGLAVATIYTRHEQPAETPEAGAVLVSERQSFGKEENRGAVLFSGGKGWQITFRGARPLPEHTVDRFKESALHNIFYILRHRLREPGLIFEFRGTDIVANLPVELVDITDAENRVVTVYFHRTTKLPMRQSYVWRDPKTRERNEELTIFSKYRDVGGGVQWPYDIERLRNGQRVFQIFSENVQIDQKLPDKLFSLPGNLKILPPSRISR